MKVENWEDVLQDLTKKLYDLHWFPLVRKPREIKAKRRNHLRGNGQLDERLRRLGLRASEVGGGGNCMFLSIAQVLLGDR